ncbi:MAG: hypothetical protein IT370_00755 [Deltaproteobacteria bacterium]|nr:hypothetical protein [Deltaproteobacteria bacterium]
MPLDRDRIVALLAAAADELTGDWLLIGGAAAAVWFAADRVTEDIDLVSLSGAQADRLALLELGERVGLAPEALNSAADYFVRRIPGWERELELHLRGRSAAIHRPTVTLFLLLKLGRLSEQDLSDCERLIAFARAHGASWDATRVVAAIDAAAATDDVPLRERRQRLRGLLSG